MHVKTALSGPIQSLHPVPGQGCIPCIKFASKMQMLTCKPVSSSVSYGGDLFSPIYFFWFTWSNGGPMVPILLQEFEAAYLGRKNTSKYAFLDANARLGKECVWAFVLCFCKPPAFAEIRTAPILQIPRFFFAFVVLLNSVHAKWPDVCSVVLLDGNEWTEIMT